MIQNQKQIAASRKSSWRSSGGSGCGASKDCGQRYEIRYKDGMGQERAFGWTNSLSERDKMLAAIAKNPMWSGAHYLDRGAQR